MVGITRAILLVLFLVALVVAEDRLPQGYKIVKPFICRPKTQLKIDCNICRCSSDAGIVGTCTRIGCSSENGKCYPHSYFRIQNVLCLCPANGRKWDSECFSKFP